jgi:hypothetical protein
MPFHLALTLNPLGHNSDLLSTESEDDYGSKRSSVGMGGKFKAITESVKAKGCIALLKFSAVTPT